MEIIVSIFIGLLVFFWIVGVISNHNKKCHCNSVFWPKRYDERLDKITSVERGTQSERDLISALLDYGI